jgi:asparagine synthase (glutamine-hydrolysing)
VLEAEPALQPLEVACGHPLGSGPPVALPSTTASPLEALEAAAVTGLRQAPCLVSFSGGVDSTLVLAVAVGAARRHGLPAPIPVTWRFPGAPATDETGWQERVIAELGIRDWERLTAGDELDFVGPVAQRVLTAHGLLHPPNAFLHEPLLRRAAGGALLTGIGGDQVLGLWRGRWLWDVLARRRRAGRRTPLALLRALPASPALAALERRRVPDYSWLTAPARHEVVRRYSRQRAAEPAGWSAHLGWRLALRDTMLLSAAIDRIADAAGASVVNPLLDRGFVAALARAGGRMGFGNRRDTISALFSELMPAAALERRDKARFGEVFWDHATRELTAEWDGEGIDAALIDPDALRRLWTGDEPAVRTALLVQQLWLERRRAARPYAMPQPSNGPST